MSQTLFINFKNYHNGLGKSGINLAHEISSITQQEQIYVNIVINPTLLSAISIFQNNYMKVYCANVDAINSPKSTGFISAHSVSSLSIHGVVLNHAEHKIMDRLYTSIKQCLDENLHILICFSDENELTQIKSCIEDLKSEYTKLEELVGFAYEPSSLIGNSNQVGAKSVMETEKKNIEKYRKILLEYKLLAGAGVKNIEDFQLVDKYYLNGVFLSSIILEAQEPLTKVKEFLAQVKEFLK